MYKHTQLGKVIIIILIIALVFTFLLKFIFSQKSILGIDLTIYITAGIFLICLLLFYSLTITVDNEEIKIIFGIGLIKKSYKLDNIVQVEIVKNPLIFSFGIHKIPNGWIYNVSGRMGIELTLKDGRKIRIGSDEPEKLAENINKKIES